MNKKTFWLAGFMLLAAAILVLPVGAKAEMYVEGYIGGAQAANMGQSFTAAEISTPGGATPVNFPLHYSGKSDPAVIGGVKIGTWFVKEGFLGYNYPEWMKYFGFYTDFSYQRLSFRGQKLTGSVVTQGGAFIHDEDAGGSFKSDDGFVATWAFMFAARYGFLQDSEVPFGRLQPYVAVGPAILWTSMSPKLHADRSDLPNSLQVNGGSHGDCVIALAADAGVRYMALKNVSIDLSFRYRYAQPSFQFTGLNSPIDNNFTTFKLDPVYHLFSGQLGVAYHF